MQKPSGVEGAGPGAPPQDFISCEHWQCLKQGPGREGGKEIEKDQNPFWQAAGLMPHNRLCKFSVSATGSLQNIPDSSATGKEAWPHDPLQEVCNHLGSVINMEPPQQMISFSTPRMPGGV